LSVIFKLFFMTEEIKSIDTPQPSLPKDPVLLKEKEQVNLKKPSHSNVHYIIYFVGGLLEILLLFRLVFKLTAADASSGFVSFIYAVTDFFVAPYAVFVFEPGTVVAMAVYAFLAWGIAKIIAIAVGRRNNVE